MNTFVFEGKICARCQQALTKAHAATWRWKLADGAQRFFCSNYHHNLWMAQTSMELDQQCQQK